MRDRSSRRIMNASNNLTQIVRDELAAEIQEPPKPHTFVDMFDGKVYTVAYDGDKPELYHAKDYQKEKIGQLNRYTSL